MLFRSRSNRSCSAVRFASAAARFALAMSSRNDSALALASALWASATATRSFDLEMSSLNPSACVLRRAASLLAFPAAARAAPICFCDPANSLSASSSIRSLYGYAPISRRIANAKATKDRVLNRDFNTTVSWKGGNLHVQWRVFHVHFPVFSRHSITQAGPEDSPNRWTATSKPTSNAKNASAHPSNYFLAQK